MWDAARPDEVLLNTAASIKRWAVRAGDESATFELKRLPRPAARAFDCSLIAQALAHQISVLTSDRLIHRYPVAVR